MAAAETDALARQYVALALALGEHYDGYIDAYYGPSEWRENLVKLSVEEIVQAAAQLQTRLGEISSNLTEYPDEAAKLRPSYLGKQLRALETFAKTLLPGAFKLKFDEESRLLYDAVAPQHSDKTFAEVLQRLDGLLPGDGTLIERYAVFKSNYIIPPTRLSAVFDAALAKTREFTKKFIEMPASESFVVEYVTNKPWSGYNWYKGDFFSVIQVNTDLPIYIDRAIDLAAHEGYPGHHVYNMLLEKHLYRDRGMVEFCVYPLFSPQSLIAEGSANYGIDMCFPTVTKRVQFERDVLFPLAGLDPASAQKYYEIEELVHELSYAGNEAARRYLNGVFTKEQTADWLTKFALMPPDRARQRTSFIETYRSYVISYNLGMDMVAQHIDSVAKSTDDNDDSIEQQRWDSFKRLLSLPLTPSDLVL